MSDARRCRVCGSLTEVRRENYKYDASGLDNITLESIEVRHCPKCGERQALIPALGELHKSIAFALAEKRERLLPKEIRFLRKYLGLSGADLAAKIGVDRATVSRYESPSDPQPMGKQTERLLRLMVIWEKQVQSYPLEELATQEPRSVHLTLVPKKGGWERHLEAPTP
jgi:putative zinc finger/helix-turn-helix YgiT family protein